LVSLVAFLTSVSTCILFYHSFFWTYNASHRNW
jgi:hypothetical protein